MKKFLLIYLFFGAFLKVNGKEYSITEYGARPDTSVLSTAAIQKAIDECSKTGGRVIIPAGTYKTGTLYLKNSVTLYLEKGAVLYGSTRLSDYPENLPEYTFYRKGIVKRALIYAENCTDITIEGEGLIDGQGAAFRQPEGSATDSYTVRPYLLWIIRCRNVKVEGIRLRNSAMWMQHYLACDGVYIHNIDVFNHSNKNNDLMDIDGCRNVRISDVTGDSDDDGITLKSTSGSGNENIAITNCVISSHCNAIKMGTESNTGFKNIAISNIVIRPSRVTDKSIEGDPRGHTGIALETVDGAVIDGVTITNVTMDGPICPIFIRLGNRGRGYYPGQRIETPGALKNVSISHVIARNAGKNGCSITGLQGYPVENISLDDITIEFEGGGTSENYQNEVPEKEKSYPEYDMFGDLPAYGFYVRHAKGIRFSGIRLKTKQDDYRPAFVLSDVYQANLNDLLLESTKANICNIMAENSGDIMISNSSVLGFSNALLELRAKNQRIMLNGNRMYNVGATLTKSSDARAVKEVNSFR